MGDIVSSPSQSNPSSTTTATSNPTMTSSNSSQSSQSRSATVPIRSPESKTPDTSIDTKITETNENPAEKETLLENVPEDSTKEGEEEEEEEGECGFCLFMKGGGCKDTFIEWEKCVEEGEKNEEDIVEKCFQATSALKKCMEAHSDYYAPLLQAEEAAVKQLEEEKERLNNQEIGGEESGKKEKEEGLDDSEKKETS